MSSTPSQLNVDNLPDDVRQALRDTFGNEFTPGMSMDQLFAPSNPEPAIVTPESVPNETASDQISAPSITEPLLVTEEVLDLENLQPATAVEPVVEVNAAPSLKAEIEEEVPIEKLSGKKKSSTSKKVVVEKTISDSIAIASAKLTTKLEAKLISESALRYSDANWYENVQKSRITVLGAGGIGSWAVLLLSKFSVPITLFDGDKFEVVNQAGQIFLLRDMNSYKASAIVNLCYAINGTTSIGSSGNWNRNYGLEKITIVAVDNMEVRKAAFLHWLASYKNQPDALFIDARLAAEMFQIYSIKATDKRAQERYLAEWFPDEAADETPCSYKQTAYMAAMLGGRIVNHYVNFLSSAEKDMIPRIVPFFVEYEAYGYEKIVNYA